MADMAKAETTQLQESQNLESTILSEQHYMQKCVELEQLHKAYQGSVEKVAALTNTTLDQVTRHAPTHAISHAPHARTRTGECSILSISLVPFALVARDRLRRFTVSTS